MNYIASIGNEELNVLPTAEFGGRIFVVDTVEKMVEAQTILNGEKLLGIDTETRPSFSKGHSHKMALLQVSTDDVALLFRLNKVDLSDKVRSVLQDENVIKIGAALNDDMRGLLASQGQMKLKGFVDLQKEVGKWEIVDKSVKKMAGIVLGVRVSKAQRLSNWEANVLTPAQMMYAAVDAWICLKIYKKLIGYDKD